MNNIGQRGSAVKVYVYLQGWDIQVKKRMLWRAIAFLKTHRRLSGGVIYASLARDVSTFTHVVEPIFGGKTYVALFFPNDCFLNSLDPLRCAPYDWEAFVLSPNGLCQPFASANDARRFFVTRSTVFNSSF